MIDSWKEIDSFLYYDFWHRNGHDKSEKIRTKNLDQIFNKLESNKIKFYLHKKTIFNVLDNSGYDLKAYSECLIIEKKCMSKVKDIISKLGFEIVYFDKYHLKILRDNRLIEIYFDNIRRIFQKNIEITLFDLSVPVLRKDIIYCKVFRKTKKISKKIISKYNYLKLKFYKKYENNIFNKFFNPEIVDLSNIYKINIETFLNLKIESKYSPSWIVRKKHLNLVTNNKKYLRVKDIVKFLKRNNNLEMLMTNVDESKLDNQILGSVSHSKYFWNTGNNYFLYSAFFEFKKDVIPYKNVNEYISSCSSEYVYSKNYYEKLESMNESEIVKFLNDNPIEITDNCITSGKHRVFAMIGRLVREKDYVAFSGKIVSH